MDYDFTTSLEAIAPGVTAEIGAVQAPNESWVDSLTRLLPVLATTYQQKQLLEENMRRAQQGLAPIDVSQYSPAVRVGMTDDTKKMMYIAAAVVAALIALYILKKKRR